MKPGTSGDSAPPISEARLPKPLLRQGAVETSVSYPLNDARLGKIDLRQRARQPAGFSVLCFAQRQSHPTSPRHFPPSSSLSQTKSLHASWQVGREEFRPVVTRLLTNFRRTGRVCLMRRIPNHLALFMLFAATLHAQKTPAPTPPKPADPPKAEKAPAPPAIPVELRAKFFKAQAENMAASQAMEKAAEALPQYATSKAKGEAMQAVIQELVRTCGKDFMPSLSSDKDPETAGDPVCIAKPVPPKPAEKK